MLPIGILLGRRRIATAVPNDAFGKEIVILKDRTSDGAIPCRNRAGDGFKSGEMSGGTSLMPLACKPPWYDDLHSYLSQGNRGRHLWQALHGLRNHGIEVYRQELAHEPIGITCQLHAAAVMRILMSSSR
jgi:hypothetical protein